jgi:hypothetical protein
VYGATGTTDLVGIAEALRASPAQPGILHAAMLLVIAGFGFKVTAVPFDFWAPDTYSGSPLPGLQGSRWVCAMREPSRPKGRLSKPPRAPSSTRWSISAWSITTPCTISC